MTDVTQPTASSPTASRPATLSSVRLTTLALLLAVAVVIWFGNTAYRALSEPDEGRYAEIPREMLATGDWVIPRLDGIPYLEKPPLQYWATAAAYSVFGLEPWVSRLWPALLGFLGLAATYLTARTIWNERAAQLATWILASCPLYFIVAHLNTLDIALSFFVNAALSCFLMAIRRSGTTQRRWMDACWALLACAFLQKGLVALALPGLTLVVYSLIYRDWPLWRQLSVGRGLLIIGAICLPWLILATLRQPGFLQFFFIHEHLERFTTTEHKRVEPWWFFIVILLSGTLPWIVQIGRSVLERRVATVQRFNVEVFLLIWVVVQLVFFSLSGSKLAPYIVPLVPPLAMLAGRWLDQHASARKLWPTIAVSGVFTLLLLGFKWLVPHFIQPGLKLDAYLQMANFALLAGVAAAVGCILAVRSIYKLNVQPAVAFVSGGLVVALSALMCGTNALGSLRSKPEIASLIAPQLDSDTAFYCIGMYWQALPFTLKRTCTMVQYTGEFEVQFDPERRHWLPTLEDFLTHWRQQSSAVAIVNPDLMSYLEASGEPLQVILRDPSVVVIAKPATVSPSKDPS